MPTKRPLAPSGHGEQQQDILSCFRRQSVTAGNNKHKSVGTNREKKNCNTSKRRKRDDEGRKDKLLVASDKENKLRQMIMTATEEGNASSDYDSDDDVRTLSSLISSKPKVTDATLTADMHAKIDERVHSESAEAVYVGAEAGVTRQRALLSLSATTTTATSIGIHFRKVNADKKEKLKPPIVSSKSSLLARERTAKTKTSIKSFPGALVSKDTTKRSPVTSAAVMTERCIKPKKTGNNASYSTVIAKCHESLGVALDFLQFKRETNKNSNKRSVQVSSKASSSKALKQDQDGSTSTTAVNRNDLTPQDIQGYFKAKRISQAVSAKSENQSSFSDANDSESKQGTATTVSEQKRSRVDFSGRQKDHLSAKAVIRGAPLGLCRSASTQTAEPVAAMNELATTETERTLPPGDPSEAGKRTGNTVDSTGDEEGGQERRLRKSQNLIHQLVDRSVFGSRGRMPRHGPKFSHSIVDSRHAARRLVAKPTSWINLGDTSRENVTTTTRIDCMAWDPLGVLLAVGQSCSLTKQHWIEIYDWDTVCAADRQGRSDRMRAIANNQKSRTRLHIPPLLRFIVPTQSTSSSGSRNTSWMRWNPHYPDQLAVASRCGSVLYCINVSHVEAALASAPRNRIMRPPRHSYWEFRSHHQGFSQGVSSCVFVGKDHIIAAFGANLHCWRYFPKRDPTSIQPRLKWLYQFSPPEKSSLNQVFITALEAVGREHLLAGSSRGDLALIQWKRVIATRVTSAFAITTDAKVPSPTLMCQWSPHTSMEQQQIPPEHVQDPSIMGVQKLRVDSDCVLDHRRTDTSIANAQHKAPGQNDFEQLSGRFCVQWITKCGWVMEVALAASHSRLWKNYKLRRGKARALYRTPLVQTKLASGGSVTTRQKLEWSLPTVTVASDASGSHMCWQNVPALTRILPHHDQRVLDDRPRHTRNELESNNFCLLLRGRSKTISMISSAPSASEVSDSHSIHSLALPKRRGRPKYIAVDPLNQEWAVVATDTEQLYIVCLRSQS